MLICVVVYFVLSVTVFFKADITATPKTERVVLNAHVTATKDAPSGLSFTVFSLTATETKDVLATETKTVNTKASGKIVVYNEYSASAQRLIKNTRFQAANSKIYRIPLDTVGLNLPSDSGALDASGYVHCRGVRNAYAMAFDANGELFAIDNSGERDDPEELNWIRPGRHYGYPWIMGDHWNPLIHPKKWKMVY